MRVDTIEQYKILEYIKENFYIEDLQLKLIDRFNIEITDKNNETMIFYFENNQVKYK